ALADAWDVVEPCFPDVNRDLIYLLIAAKGATQRRAGAEPPRIYISGQSGAGQTTHLRLAAELCCDLVRIGKISENPDRQMQHYASASKSSAFYLLDEVSKKALESKAMREFVLSLTPGTEFHELYHGTAEIENPAAVVMADIHVLSCFVEDQQTARRIVHVP